MRVMRRCFAREDTAATSSISPRTPRDATSRPRIMRLQARERCLPGALAYTQIQPTCIPVRRWLSKSRNSALMKRISAQRRPSLGAEAQGGLRQTSPRTFPREARDYYLGTQGIPAMAAALLPRARHTHAARQGESLRPKGRGVGPRQARDCILEFAGAIERLGPGSRRRALYGNAFRG